MKKLFSLLVILGSLSVNAQTITFNGCHPLFENQDYVFVKETTDATGRNVFTTTPVDGEQSCGGLGTCEFKILWNQASSRWEFIADSGNGDFVSPHLIYYNSSSSLPNPPDLTLGTWIENAGHTGASCGGSLSAGNAIMTGAVQSTLLSADEFSMTPNKVVVCPNPTSDVITLVANETIESFSVLSIQGQVVMDVKNSNKADVSKLQSGVYFIRLNSGFGEQMLRFIKK